MLNKKYVYFDDGKITPSRRSIVTLKERILLREAPKRLILAFVQELLHCFPDHQDYIRYNYIDIDDLELYLGDNGEWFYPCDYGFWGFCDEDYNSTLMTGGHLYVETPEKYTNVSKKQWEDYFNPEINSDDLEPLKWNEDIQDSDS